MAATDWKKIHQTLKAQGCTITPGGSHLKVFRGKQLIGVLSRSARDTGGNNYHNVKATFRRKGIHL